MWVVHMVCISRFTYTWVHMCKPYLTWVHVYDGVCKYTCGYMHVETQIWNLVFSLFNLTSFIDAGSSLIRLVWLASLRSGEFQLSFQSTGLTGASPCSSRIPTGSGDPNSVLTPARVLSLQNHVLNSRQHFKASVQPLILLANFMWKNGQIKHRTINSTSATYRTLFYLQSSQEESHICKQGMVLVS